MNTALGVVGGLVVGAAIGFGSATLKNAHGSGGGAGVMGGGDQPVVQVDGTKYKESELPAEVRSNLYTAQEEAHQRVDGILNQFALQLALAKAKNPAVKADSLPPFDQLVDAPAPSDADMQALYEQNKARLPPNTPYEQIKPEIEKYLKNQKMTDALRTKNDELRAANKIVLLTAAPQPPKVDLDVSAYPAKGPANAHTTLVEVADYLCPHCQEHEPEVEALLKEMGDKLHFVAVSFSLRPEGLSGTLARGAFCARQQGDDAFWKYHETAFNTAKAKGWNATMPDSKDPVLEVATAAGLDKDKLSACLDSPDAKTFVQNTDDRMHKAGVSGTPTFFENGRMLPLTQGKPLKDQVLAGMQAASH